ncbi:MAG: hypothetical protein LBR68_02185, partial [Lachnoclostridium sp.]|nr:hypothetical protein [Lachnoclostridium sp.]
KEKERLSKIYKEKDLSEEEIIEAIKHDCKNSEVEKDQRESKKRIENEEKLQRKACIETYGWNEYLLKELEFFAIHWGEIVPVGFKGSVPQFKKNIIYWQDKELDLDTFDLKYTISHTRASEIISGTDLYGINNLDHNSNSSIQYREEWIFIRELMQNAMDATKLQVFRYIQEGRYGDVDKFGLLSREWMAIPILKEIGDFLDHLTVNLYINYDTKNQSICVRVVDVGTGIDSKTLQKMCNIGSSHDADLEYEISHMPQWLRPNGSFGIGMQSVFGVVREFSGVSDSRIDRKSRNLYFQSAKTDGGIYAIERPERSKPDMWFGTKIFVDISKEVCENDKQFVNVKDEFKKSVSAIFDKIETAIENTLGNDILPFKVHYLIDEIEVKRSKEFPSALAKLYSDKESTKSFHIHMHDSDKPSPFQLQYYDDDSCTLVCMKLKPIQNMKDMIGHTDLYYRGSKVYGDSYSNKFCYPCWDIDVYIWNYETEETLTIDRNNIKQDKRSVIYNDITTAADKAVDAFVNHLLEIRDDKYINLLNLETYCTNNERGDEILNAIACALYMHRLVRETSYGKYDTLVENCNTLLYDRIFDGIELKWLSYKPVDEGIISFERNAIECFRENQSEQWMIHDLDGFNDYISIASYLDDKKKIQFTNLLFDYFSKVMRLRNQKLYMKKMSVIKVKFSLHPFIIIYTLSTNPCDFVQCSSESKNQIINNAKSYAANENYGRYIMPGILKFRDLSVDTLSYEKLYQLCIYPAGCYLIFPFSNDELNKLVELLKGKKTNISSIDEFLANENLNNTPEQLIDYVLEHQCTSHYASSEEKHYNESAEREKIKKQYDELKKDIIMILYESV